MKAVLSKASVDRRPWSFEDSQALGQARLGRGRGQGVRRQLSRRADHRGPVSVQAAAAVRAGRPVRRRRQGRRRGRHQREGGRPRAGQHRLGRHGRGAGDGSRPADQDPRRDALRRGGRLHHDLRHQLLRAEGPRLHESRARPCWCWARPAASASRRWSSARRWARE